MKALLQRLCIVLMLCIGAAAFIATSPIPPSTVSKTLTSVTILLTKDRPLRQFLVQVNNQSSPNIRFMDAEHGLKIELDPPLNTDTKEGPVKVEVAVISNTQANKSDCFASPDLCSWDGQQLGTSQSPNSPTSRFGNISDLNLRLSQNFSADTRVFIKFKLQQDTPVRVIWNYQASKSFFDESNEGQSVNSPLLSITSQEVPVD